MTIYKSPMREYLRKIGIGAMAFSLPILAGCVTVDLDGRQMTFGPRNTINNVYDENGRKVASSMGRQAGGINYINPKTGERIEVGTSDVIEGSGGYGYWGGYYPYCGSFSLIQNEQNSRMNPYDRNQYPASHD